MAESDEKFLARWSRRKGEVAATPPEPAAVEPDRPKGDEAPDEAEIVARLPDIESLDKDSDFSAFMQRGVPDALRRRALRKLWRLNPAFRVLDGMNEYDEDYTVAASIAEGVKTIYQVGKGMVREEEGEETEDLAEAGPPEEPAQSNAAGAAGPADEPTAEPAAEPAAEAVAEGTVVPDPDSDVTDEPAPEPDRSDVAKPPAGSAARRRWARFET